jgi:DNA polymerase-3 subunit delta
MFLLLHGADEFSAYEEAATLRASPDFGLNVDVFAGATADLETVRQTCETMPFLSERRLVLVEGLPKRKRTTKSDDANADEDESAPAAPPEAPAPKPARGKKGKAASSADPKAFAQALADCAAHLPDTTTLAVLVNELLEPANPLVQAAARHGKAKAFTPPKGPQLEAWITRRATHEGVEITRDAAHLLATEAGDDLRILAHEVAKLGTHAGKGGQIRVEDVRLLTPSSRQAKVFDLTDALARRDRPRALALLHELLAAGESPLGIVALTAFSTRSLLQVKTLAERGLRAPQIASTAGMAPFVVEKSLGMARQFTFVQLEAAHRSLLEVDAALKSSRMTPEMALDLLVVEFGATPR